MLEAAAWPTFVHLTTTHACPGANGGAGASMRRSAWPRKVVQRHGGGGHEWHDATGEGGRTYGSAPSGADGGPSGEAAHRPEQTGRIRTSRRPADKNGQQASRVMPASMNPDEVASARTARSSSAMACARS